MNPTIKFQPQKSQPVDDAATGAEVKAYREACGVKQDALGKKLGVSGVTISHREKGRFAWTKESFDAHIKAINQLK